MVPHQAPKHHPHRERKNTSMANFDALWDHIIAQAGAMKTKLEDAGLTPEEALAVIRYVGY